jgi:hypothetical protein
MIEEFLVDMTLSQLYSSDIVEECRSVMKTEPTPDRTPTT